jgi:PAS domain S-box-containing protein
MHREPLLIADAYEDPRFLKEVDHITGYRTKSVLGFPIIEKMELKGIFQLFNKSEGPFTDEDVSLTESCVRCVQMALKNIRLEIAVDKVSARNASIIENLSGGFIAVDIHGRMILCNPAARRILEIPESLGPNPALEEALIHIPKLAESILETLAAKRTLKRQELNWSLHGEERRLGYSTILIQDTKGGINGAGATFQDITAVKSEAGRK